MKRWFFITLVALALLFLTAGMCDDDDDDDDNPPAVDPNSSLNPNATNGTSAGNTTTSGNNTGAPGGNASDSTDTTKVSCISDLTVTGDALAAGNDTDYMYSYRVVSCENGVLTVNMLTADGSADLMETQQVVADVPLEQNGTIRTALDYDQVCVDVQLGNESQQECAQL